MPVLCNDHSIGHSWQGFPRQSLGRGCSRIQGNRAGHPGATSVAASDLPGGPGSGLRSFPRMPVSVSQSQPVPRERDEKFALKTTKDYYKDFPGLIRSSFPLYIRKAGKQEPLGKLEQQEEDAGPQTGQRRMPGTVDPEGRQRPRAPWMPDNEQEALLQERMLRHVIGK